MVKVTDEQFEEMVERAIDSIPDSFLGELENIVFFAEYEPDESQLYEDEVGDEEVLDGMFGLFEGPTLYERLAGYGDAEGPSVVTVFKRAHERACATVEEMAEEVRRTVVHEVGHYFDMDEERVSEMGYE